jgi:prepilin-type N-terminal cleavage/methylation domain-containing protein
MTTQNPAHRKYCNYRATKLNSQGFSLIEILVVIVIILIVLSLSVRILSNASFANVDSITATLAGRIAEIRKQALGGQSNVDKRTFRLKAVQDQLKSSRGVVVSTTLPASAKGASTCNTLSCPNAICLPNETLCYTIAENFTFDQYTGQKTTNHAFFVTNAKRTLAVVATESGQVKVLELTQGKWVTRKFR